MMKKKVICWVIAMLLAPFQVSAADFDETATYQSLFRMLSTSFDKNGDSDLYGFGSGDFTRLLWDLNELPTDEATCWWNDQGIPELNTNSWDDNLLPSQTMFQRLHNGIFKANLYLERAPATLAQRRAEVRFVRALFYFHALDLFGNVPLMTSTQTNLFVYYYDYARAVGLDMGSMSEDELKALQDSYTDNSVERPKQVGCKALFDFISNELKACEADLPMPGAEVYTRPSKAAAWLLLARLYLNAEVYTGTAQWAEAKAYAKKVIDSNAYALSSSFSALFMGDNDSNGAQREMLFPIYSGSEAVPSWGCMTFLIGATYDFNMPDNGTTERWAGIRARKALVSKFDVDSDVRAMFYTQGHTLDITDLQWGFSQGYAVTKFTNMRSDGLPASSQFVETDWPLMRLAEAYLTYAEADAHQNGGTCSADGADHVNTLRARAGAAALSKVTLSDIADEWAREFMFEGRRRSDLVRLGLFTGGSYLWDWKGGQQAGVAIDSHLSRYPMPEVMMNLSEDYVQNPGYMDINKVQIDKTFTLNTPDFAAQTVALRDVVTLNFTWQAPSVTGVDASKLVYSLQMSPSGNFGQAQSEDEYIGLGTGVDTYYSFDSGVVDVELLDQVLLAWKRVKRWSDLPRESYDIFFRCVASIGNKKSVSNVVKITVRPYVNNVNATNYYLVGRGIGDGLQTLTHDGIGTSMLPMDINYKNYGIGWGWEGSGDYTLTTRLEKNSPFWIRQMRPGIYYCTLDGTVDSAELMQNSRNVVPDESQMFTVSETGTYEIVLKRFPDWARGSDGEWHPLPMLTVTKKDDVPSTVGSVSISGDATATLQRSAADHIWYGSVTLEKEGHLHFVVDGRQWGDTGFSFGYAKAGAIELTVPAGSYIVTFNSMTGFYDFYNTDDARFIWDSPYRLMFVKTMKIPVQNYYFVGWLTQWDLSDSRYPFTTSDGIIYHLLIPAPESASDGWFKIAGEAAMTERNWDEEFLTAPHDDCAELEGWVISGGANSGGAWHLPVLTDGSTHYDLQFNVLSSQYQFVPTTPESIQEIPYKGNAARSVYTLGGMRVKSNVHQLPKGIYVVDGRKVVIN